MLIHKGNDQCERWGTPLDIFVPLLMEFNFDLDAAADAETKLLSRYLTDSLTKEEWSGSSIWLNPPYGRKLEPFIRKAATEADKGKTIVALIPFRCRAAWWHESVLGRAIEIRCVRKRINFIDPSTGLPGKYTNSCDSCIVIWRGHWRGITSIKGMR